MSPIHAYVAAVSVVGLGLLALILEKTIGHLDITAPAFWVFAACVVVGELVPIRINHSLNVTVSSTFAFALLMTFGMTGAIVALVAACVIDDFRHHKPAWKTAFNAGQYSFSIAAGGVALHALTNLPHHAHPTLFQGRNLLGIVVAAFAFFAVNWTMTVIRMALVEGKPVVATAIESLGLETATDAILLALAPVVVACASRSLLLIPLLALPMIAAHKSAKVSLKNLELAKSLSEQAEKNRHLALHDSLTELPNRTLFHERVEHARLLAKREDVKLAVIFLDLDRFKEINDALGHASGDALLIEVAARLKRVLRESDTVARLGGDEFGVLLPALPEEGNVIAAVDTLLAAFDEPFVWPELTLKVEASIGIALYPEHGTDAGSLIRHADVAMYAAKKTSSGYSVYASDQDQHTRDRLALVEGMRNAIDDEGFDLFYQPKMDMRTNEIIGVEALARWNHPELGYVPPDTFIPLAEHTGLIRPLTSWVLEEAIKQVHEWHNAGMMLSVAVNLSMRNVSDVELPTQVRHLLDRYNVPAEKLTLEITESSIAADPVRSTKVLSDLHEMGVEVSIDDFGTGHSSLSRLRELRIDEIKIDRSFVMNMSHSDNDAVIVRSTIDLGRNLGLRVVAEGIEDEMALHRLATLGCDVAQGYHLSRPLPAADVHDWFKWYQREALGSVAEDESAAV
ncbi:MAG: hypothetical protein QOF16_1137 [Actinomycetota bacterium]|nr:hypothetical protein [Actinomycetota bacterium]